MKREFCRSDESTTTEIYSWPRFINGTVGQGRVDVNMSNLLLPIIPSLHSEPLTQKKPPPKRRGRKGARKIARSNRFSFGLTLELAFIFLYIHSALLQWQYGKNRPSRWLVCVPVALHVFASTQYLKQDEPSLHGSSKVELLSVFLVDWPTINT